jgi:hypothetical protein
MIKRYPVHRLEQALREMEQFAYLRRMKTIVASNLKLWADRVEGPLEHFPEFRQHLLRCREPGEEFDAERFSWLPHIRGLPMPYYKLPECLYEWTKQSRRVYQIQPEPHPDITNIPIEGLRWRDIKWPFSSFGVRFAEPFFGPGGLQFDFVLFSIIDNEPYGKDLVFLGMGPELDSIGFLSEREKKLLSRLVSEEKWVKAFEYIAELGDRYKFESTYLGLQVGGMYGDNLVTAPMTVPQDINMPGYPYLGRPVHDPATYYEITRFVVRLALYLTHLPTRIVRNIPWVPMETTEDPTAVTDAAEVCTITTFHKIQAANQQQPRENRGGWEMPYHDHPGYYRRPPGKGNDPNWPKTVWVPPYEVRRDRKPLRPAVPGGGESKV